MISILKVIVTSGAMLLSATACADVMYRWVGDATNQGYGRDVKMELVLSDRDSYFGQSPGCTMNGAFPCTPQPEADLVSFSFGIGSFWMTLDPRTNRYGGTGWDIFVQGNDGYLTGDIFAFDWSDEVRMSSVGDIWTVSRIGSDRGLVIGGDITGRFEQVPEPATVFLTLISLAGLAVSRRLGR